MGVKPRSPLKRSVPGSNRPEARRSDAVSGMSLATDPFAGVDECLSSSTRPPSWALAALTSNATGLAPALSENDIAPPMSSTSLMATAHEGAAALLAALVAGDCGVAVTALATSQRSYIQRFWGSRSTRALGWVSSSLAALKVWPGTSMSTPATSTRLTDTSDTLPCASNTSLSASCDAVTCSACGLPLLAACQLMPSCASSWPPSAGSKNWPIYLAAIFSGHAATLAVTCAA